MSVLIPNNDIAGSRGKPDWILRTKEIPWKVGGNICRSENGSLADTALPASHWGPYAPGGGS